MAQEDISRKQGAEKQEPGFDPHPALATPQALLLRGPSCARQVPADPQHTAAPRRQRRVKKQVTLCCAGALFQNFPSVVFPNKARESESIVVSLGKLT